MTWVLNNYQRFEIRIVNISLGGDSPTTGKFTELDELVEEAVSHGLVVVVAAGNTGHRIIVPPASAPSAITVGGLNDQNHLDPRYRRHPEKCGKALEKSFATAPPMCPEPRIPIRMVHLRRAVLPLLDREALDRRDREQFRRFRKNSRTSFRRRVQPRIFARRFGRAGFLPAALHLDRYGRPLGGRAAAGLAHSPAPAPRPGHSSPRA